MAVFWNAFYIGVVDEHLLFFAIDVGDIGES